MTTGGARMAAALARAARCAEQRRAPLPGPTGALHEPPGAAHEPAGAAHEPAGPRHAPKRRVAMGDPQAPIERMFAVLDARALLGPDGWLAGDATLISLGDHFDWGGAGERHRAALSGLHVLSWLAAHPREQVTILAGNHDLGRIGELVGFDDNTFARAHEHAMAVYGLGASKRGAEREAEFLLRYPALPTAELAARDFAAFTTAQRDLIIELLGEHRLRVAAAGGPRTLLCHAGVTTDDLMAVGVAARDMDSAEVVAEALNHAFDQAVDRWLASGRREPLAIPHLHRPGDRAFGEGRGMFYHRPCHPEFEPHAELFDGPYRRRFDPRRLPPGLIQIIGHISDSKCRQLLGPWASPEPTPPGALRHLIGDNATICYRPGLPDTYVADSAIMIFADGRMHHTEPDDYELVDLDRIAPA